MLSSWSNRNRKTLLITLPSKKGNFSRSPKIPNYTLGERIYFFLDQIGIEDIDNAPLFASLHTKVSSVFEDIE